MMLGNGNYQYLYIYFRNILIELKDNVPENRKHYVRSILKNVLLKWDTEFLNFICELSVLNNLIKTGFRLEKVEEKMENSKGMDFTVIDQDGKAVLIEVVNFSLEPVQGYDDDRLVRWLTGKQMDKYNDQAKDGLKRKFTLVPVLWGTHVVLKRIKDLYETRLDLTAMNIHEPMAYSCLILKDKSYRINFSRIRNIFIIDGGFNIPKEDAASPTPTE